MLDNELNQEDIDLLKTMEGGANPVADPGAAAAPSTESVPPGIAEPTMEELEMLKNSGLDIPLPEISAPHSQDVKKIRTKDFEQLASPTQPSASHGIDMLLDVSLPIAIELGRTAMSIEDILNLGPGSIVELDKLAGEPVDLLVNDKLIAKGEVVVVDENFGIRITSMVSQQERIKSLR